MNRRNFLKNALASGIAASFPTLGLQQASAEVASEFPEIPQKIVVFLHLAGGPDFRHLMPPPYDPSPSSYGYQYWQARAAAHELDPGAPQSWADRWANEYTEFSDQSTSFGILNSAGWLQSMWDSGNVSIINNIVGGTTRNHIHCQLILDQGNVDSTPNDTQRSGWGGRLSEATGGNVVSVTRTPRRFCFGTDPNDPEKSSASPIISAVDSRNMALYEFPPAAPQKLQISRSLKAYYAAKKNVMPTQSLHRRFIEHEIKLRNIGTQINARLASEPIPEDIEALYSGDATLASTYFGKQIRNLLDCLIVTDLLDMKVVSMEYPGWDTHHSLKTRIEPMFSDIFGSNGGLSTLYQSLPDSVADKLVFVISGEFGRQLKANGGNGTDHGRGNSMIVIGNSINGPDANASSTLYGDMFPLSELDRLDERSPDIEGLTEIDHVLGAVCDGVQSGAGDAVFPHRDSRILETGVDLSSLYG